MYYLVDLGLSRAALSQFLTFSLLPILEENMFKILVGDKTKQFYYHVCLISKRLEESDQKRGI